MKLNSAARFLMILVFVIATAESASAQWSQGSTTTAVYQPSAYSGGQTGYWWTRDWYYDTGGTITPSITSTNVKVTVSNFYADAGIQITSHNISTNKLVTENPSGLAQATWNWSGTPGGAAPVGVVHTLDYVGSVYTRAIVGGFTGGAAFAWPIAEVEVQTRLSHTPPPSPPNSPAYDDLHQGFADAYVYAEVDTDGSAVVDPEVTSSGPTSIDSPTEDQSTGTGAGLGTASGDFEVSYSHTYTTPYALSWITAKTEVYLYVNAQGSVAPNPLYESDAYCEARSDLTGFSEVRLNF
jgi:hypothetical protein